MISLKANSLYYHSIIHFRYASGFLLSRLVKSTSENFLTEEAAVEVSLKPFQSTFLNNLQRDSDFPNTSYFDILLPRSRSSLPSTLCQAARGFWLSRSRPSGFMQRGCPGTPMISPTSSRTTRMLNSCSFSVGIHISEIFSGNFVSSGYNPGSVEM